MRRFVLLLSMSVVAIAAWSFGTEKVKKVKYPGGKCYMYRLTLTDKEGTPFSLERPEEYLSPRAVERRLRQGLAVDTTDLPVSPVYISRIASAGVSVVSSSKWNNSVLVRGGDRQLLESLDSLPFVAEVRRVWTSPDSIAPALKREKMSNVLNKWDTIAADGYGRTYEQTEMLNGVRMHSAGFTGEGKIIAVMDGGFMNADVIPAFMAMKIVGARDFVVPQSDDIYSEMSHGTMVLSAMAANLPGVYVGVAPDAGYLLLRCEDNRTESLAEEDYWAAAAEYADSAGADIINSSLGFHGFDEKSDNYVYSNQDGLTAMISRTASMLAGKGIVLVCSAGNDGMETWKKIDFPADAYDILSVGAVCTDGINASFSAVGPTADGRIKPDVMALGSPASVISGHGTLSKDIGTSFSTPLIAGMVACLWQALPDKTAREVMELVRRSGDNYSTPDNIRGYGVPDFWLAYTLGMKKNSHAGNERRF